MHKCILVIHDEEGWMQSTVEGALSAVSVRILAPVCLLYGTDILYVRERIKRRITNEFSSSVLVNVLLL